MPRPYKVIVGASFAAKPPQIRRAKQKVGRDFPETSDLALWKRRVLAWPKSFPSADAGEDFFFVQEVSRYLDTNIISVAHIANAPVEDAESIG